MSETNPIVDVTGLLVEWKNGDRAALDRMMPLVHRELHRLAHRCLRGERHADVLQTTALINEAYLRLVDITRVDWRDRAHFLAVCATMMRRILVELARSRRSLKRGAGAVALPIDEEFPARAAPVEDLITIDNALEALAELDPRKARVIELRFFGGLSVEESAICLSVSPDTVMRDWRLGRAWLLAHISTEVHADRS
ncbi:MAG TPA: sigma-70 family RNA polymerase sigma factor [Vicinamibacterales bacterium]|nr:sigma-70 family RNA polymerase sigma factor [Vicinamibacterales bacterium]